MLAFIPSKFPKYDLKTLNYDLKISVAKNIITSMPFIKDFTKIITGYTQKNGAVSKVNKKFISHLPLLHRTWKMNFGAQIQGERSVICFFSFIYDTFDTQSGLRRTSKQPLTRLLSLYHIPSINC